MAAPALLHPPPELPSQLVLRQANLCLLRQPCRAHQTQGGSEGCAPQLGPDHVRSQADCAKGMIFVPGGHYVYRGRPYDGSLGHTVTRAFNIAPYCIDEFEVAMYARGLCKGCPSWSACRGSGFSLTCYTQSQADHYCAHRERTPGGRLPIPEEILFAALGTDGRKFPWGDSW